MEFQRFLSFSLLILVSFLCSTQAYNFYVGGKDGWGLNPNPNYNQWAERNRFQVNDSIVFKYKKGSDSVLVVSEEDYENCNTKNPIKTLNGGDSIFKFDRSGPFYFISGEEGNCSKGVKLIVVVMAVRNKTLSSSPSPSPTPVATPKISPSPVTPPSPSPSPLTAPSPSPSKSTIPSSSPAPSTLDLSPSADGNTTSGGKNAQTPAHSSSSSLVSFSSVVGSVLIGLALYSFLGSF